MAPSAGDGPGFDQFLRRRLSELESTALRLQRRAHRIDEQIAIVRRCIALLPAASAPDVAGASTPSPVPDIEPRVDAAAVAITTAAATASPQVAWVRAAGDAAGTPPPLRAKFLGGFELYRGDEQIRPNGGAKVWRLVKMLLAAGGGPVSRDVLVDAFWRRARATAATQSLYSAIHAARQLLGGADPDAQNYLVCDGGHYQIAPGVGIASDVAYVREQQGEGRRLRRLGDVRGAIATLERAVTAYAGPFLPDEPYEAWATADREALAARHLDTLVLLAELTASIGAQERSAEWHRRILEADNLREESHRVLITFYAAHGQRSRAVQQYRALERALKRELGIAPDSRTRSAYESAITGER